MSNQISRRTLLTAVPASGVALALPTCASAGNQTPILKLYAKWQDACDEADNLCTDEEIDNAVDHLVALEDQMMELRSECAADLAAKIGSYTRWGECPDLPPLESPFWDELRVLIAGHN